MEDAFVPVELVSGCFRDGMVALRHANRIDLGTSPFLRQASPNGGDHDRH